MSYNPSIGDKSIEKAQNVNKTKHYKITAIKHCNIVKIKHKYKINHYKTTTISKILQNNNNSQVIKVMKITLKY